MANALPPLPCRRLLSATMLRFRLDSQHFIELIKRGDIIKALEFSQSDLQQYPKILRSWIENTRALDRREGGDYNENGVVDSPLYTFATSHPPRPTASLLIPTYKLSTPMASSMPKAVFRDHDGSDSESDWEPVSCEELKEALSDAQTHMTNAAALVAYPQPTQCPINFLLDDEFREQLAEDVNTAILTSMEFPPESCPSNTGQADDRGPRKSGSM